MLKSKLKNNQLTIGSWITIGCPGIIEIMASAGFEWLVIDLEHTAINLETVQILISTIQYYNIKAFVRVSKNEEVIIKRVLDIGADGIIVPMITSKEDAQKAINFTYYPPLGKRGVGLYRAQNYGTGFEKYKKWLKNKVVIIAQIEHIDAVKNIDDILSFNEIDGIIIGPYDLSASMGFPGEYHRKDVKDAIEKVKLSCKKHNKPFGFHVIESNPEKVIEKIKEGATFLAYSLDFFFLGDKAREGMKIVIDNLELRIENGKLK